MNAAAVIRLLEAAAFGALSAAEQETALANLAVLPTYEEFGYDCVSTRDLGFARPDGIQIFGMKGRDRKLFQTTEVDPHTICYSQRSVAVPGLKAYITGTGIITGPAEERWAELPEAILYNDRLYVYGGHTRLSVQMLAGRSLVRIRVVAFDGKNYSKP